MTTHTERSAEALKSIERAARKLRSAEALVKDQRLALDQEIWLAIDSTRATLADVATAAGQSRQACYDALKREDARKDKAQA